MLLSVAAYAIPSEHQRRHALGGIRHLVPTIELRALAFLFSVLLALVGDLRSNCTLVVVPGICRVLLSTLHVSSNLVGVLKPKVCGAPPAQYKLEIRPRVRDGGRASGRGWDVSHRVAKETPTSEHQPSRSLISFGRVRARYPGMQQCMARGPTLDRRAQR